MGAKRKRKRAKPEPTPAVVVSLVSSDDSAEYNRDQAAKAVMEILMAQGFGESLTEERARLLIESTRCQFGSNDVEAWADACMLAMAVDNEIDDEATDVRIAMADSLREAEAAQPSTSLQDKPVAVVLEHFSGEARSEVAAYLLEADRPTLLGRSELMDLLDLEARCAKWYGASSRAYFKELMDSLRETEDDAEAGGKLKDSLHSIRVAVLIQGRDDFFAPYKTVEDVIRIDE